MTTEALESHIREYMLGKIKAKGFNTNDIEDDDESTEYIDGYVADSIEDIESIIRELIRRLEDLLHN